MCVLCGPGPGAAVVDHSITHPFELEPDSDYECSVCHQHVSRHPDKMEYLARRQMEVIVEHGHQVMSIMGDDEPDWSYTVGRTVKDRPELLITGDMHPQQRASILNSVAAQDDVSPISPGMLRDVMIVPLKIVAVDPTEASMFAAVEAFGDDVVAYQVIWPDAEGRYPGEGFSIEGNGDDFQPVYGVLP